MPCLVCEHYFISNPCTDYDSIPKFIKEHIKKLKWYNKLKSECPCRECIVGTMCDRVQSLKCNEYNKIVSIDILDFNQNLQLWF